MLKITITRGGEERTYQMVAHPYEQMLEDDVELAQIQQTLGQAEQEVSRNSDNFIYRLKIANNKALAVVVSSDKRHIVTVYYHDA